MSWDPRDCPESGTERRYCNKRALQGILEQKIKKIAAPAKIQIQKFDQKGGQRTKKLGGGLFLQGKITKGGGSEKKVLGSHGDAATWELTSEKEPPYLGVVTYGYL
jgi:hypothetical protein